LTRWIHPPALRRDREQARFDPVVEGSRYKLARELSLAIWDRVRADATDLLGRCDTDQAERRFHELAARIAARGGRLHPDVGRLTRVATETVGSPNTAWIADELAPRTPGRTTLVAAEQQRWAAMDPTAAAATYPAGRDPPAADRANQTEPLRHRAPPHADEVAQVLASMQRPSPSVPARPADPAPSPDRQSLDLGLSIWSIPAQPREPHDGRLPAATLERMEQAYGQPFADVEIHTDSPEVPLGQQAFTRGRHIYFETGAFEPASDRGEQVIAHELAHVAQQAQSPTTSRPATRNALEADAHQAALAAVAGRTATVNLFAPPSAALGYSEGQSRQPNAPAPGSAGRPSDHSAHGGPPALSSPSHGSATRAPTTGGFAGAGARSTATPTARPAASQTAATAAPTAIPRRGASGDGLLMPDAPSALTPAAAARLQTIHAGNQGVAAATTTLPTADHQTDVARGAVEEPQAEQDAHAQHDVVAGVDDRPPPSPEIEQAVARIRQVIRDKRPPDEDKLVDAKPREMAQEAGQQMSSGVEQRAGTVRQGYADMQNHPQGTPSTTPVPATLPPERAQTQPVDAASGAPDPLHHDDVSLDGDVAAQHKSIQDAGMDTEPGKLVKDGPIGDARGGVDDLEHMAKTDPQKVLADQAAAIAHAKGDMQALQAAAEKALANARAGAVGHFATHNTLIKGSEEQQRAQAGAQMQAIFTQTQKSVDALLQPLSNDAVARWDAGVAQLSTEFEASLAEVKRKIDERHSGWTGAVTGAWDWATGLPDWVTDSYDRAEAKFGDGATNLIRDISRDVNQVIEDCKKLIALARKDIDAIVKSLPASLQTWAQGEAAKLGQKLDQLSQHVDQTQHNINQELIHRANGAVQQVREQVADLREKAKGAIAKVAAALVEFLKDPFKAIVNGLLRVLGIPPGEFWSLVDQLGNVVGAIAKDPVKFGKTLISGAGQGFKQFFEHFPTHLKEILMGWLFGQLGTAGIPMPTDFSGPGIMPTVLGIIGIDSSTIMSMLGADGSDPAEMAEIHQELHGVLSGDPHALVALFRDHFDPASLIPMIREAAMGFLLQALIMQVAPRIAAMLVPGGAILEAVEAIFKVLMWVVTNAARIFTLIQSLVATAGQAVAGNTSGVAAGVESGLVQIIVLVIDFLAGYIGLGGIGAKLKGVIMKVAGKLKGVLKKVLDAIKKHAKAKAKAKHPDTHKPADKKPDADKPSTHKPDDRDPQKAKDDAKDPRNHKADPDDKDPRHQHKDYDDNDPRNHKPHTDDDPKKHKHDDDPKKHKDHDDHDPKKHKDHDDDHDPKKRKNEDDAENEAPFWRLKRPFRTDIEAHTLMFTGKGAQARLTVRSIERPLEAYVERVHEMLGKLDDKMVPASEKAEFLADLKLVSGIQDELYLLRTELDKRGKRSKKYWGQRDGKRISELLGKIAHILAKLPDPDTTDIILKGGRPPSKIEYGGLYTTVKAGDMTDDSLDGSWVRAHLSSDPAGNVGSAAGRYSALYRALSSRRPNKVFAAHLLNHNLYGSGMDLRNLVPATKEFNDEMETTFESTMKSAVIDQNKVAFLNVTVRWPSNPDARAGYYPEDKRLPESIDFSLEERKFDAEAFRKNSLSERTEAMKKWSNWKHPDILHARTLLHVPYNHPGELSLEERLKLEIDNGAYKEGWSGWANRKNLYNKNKDIRGKIERYFKVVRENHGLSGEEPDVPPNENNDD
jgi:hypothetical protein